MTIVVVDLAIDKFNRFNIALRLNLSKDASLEEIREKYINTITGENIDNKSTDNKSKQNVNETHKKIERGYKFFRGLLFYFTDQTEILVLITFILNYLFNRNILSALYPAIGLIIVLLSPRPYPRKKSWKLVRFGIMIIISIRIFFQLPGWCLETNEERSYDYISLSFNQRHIHQSRIQCSSDQLSLNSLSFIYLFFTN